MVMKAYSKRVSCVLTNEEKVRFINKMKSEYPELTVDEMLRYLIHEYVNKEK